MNLITIATCLLSLAAVGKHADTTNVQPTTAESVYDFGHVGIDYTIYHRFPLVNRTRDTLHILDVNVPCDCTQVFAADSVLAPGDSTSLNLTFTTKDFFGPQNKSFRVDTDYPALAHIKYFYLSIIGQWYDGITPHPMALFFLPPNKQEEIAIPNKGFKKLTIGDLYTQDDYFTVEKVKPEAVTGDSLKLIVKPLPNLRTGTFHSNLTVRVDRSDGGEPAILTIPVKIVRY